MKPDFKEGTHAAEKHSHYEVGYVKLRTGMAYIALAFPFIFLVSSFILMRTEFLESISAYYFSRMTERNLFVGFLVCIAFFLILYEGYTRFEDRVASIAGGLLFGVALIPMGTIGFQLGTTKVTVHGICAVLFFVCIYIIVFFCSKTTLSDLDPDRRAKYAKAYRRLSTIMIASVGLAMVVQVFRIDWLPAIYSLHMPFWVEAVGIWCFAIFWYVKTREVDPNIPWRPTGHRLAYRRGEPSA